MVKLENTEIPIWILSLEEEADSIPDSFCYFMQGINVFTLKRNAFHSIITPADKKVIKEVKTRYKENLYYLLDNVWYDFRISVDDLAQVMRYFRDIFSDQKTEAAVVLMGHPKKPKLEVLYVLQKNMNKAAVTYISPAIVDVPEEFKERQAEITKEYRKLTKQGYKLVGTIHSHSDFSAFHSGVDDADEKNFDGIHITIGNVDDKFTFCARLMVEQIEWEKFNINNLILEENTTTEDAKALLDVVSVIEFKNYIIPNAAPTYLQPRYDWNSWNHKPDFQPVFERKQLINIFNPKTRRELWVGKEFYDSHKEKFVDFVNMDEDEKLPNPKAENLLKKEKVAILIDGPNVNKNYKKQDKGLFKHARSRKNRKY